MRQYSRTVGDGHVAPAAQYRLSPPSRTATTVLSLALVSGLAWVLTVHQAGSMSGMVMGLGQVGHRMPNHMGMGSFARMWAPMMVAMMAPAVGPAALSHRRALAGRGQGVAPSVAFVGGFLVVWAVVGALYLIPYLWFRQLPVSAGASRWVPLLAGAALALAGAYQFTSRKRHCQETCGAPVTGVGDHDGGVVGGLRTGVTHGVHCLGCCWALMVVLLVVGLMNLVWMALLTLVFVAEKHWPRKPALRGLVGVLLLIVGVAVMVSPSVMRTVSGTSGGPPSMSNMSGM